jgi:glutamine synthetase
MTTPAEVLSMLKEKEVKFVDLRFTDTRGKEQHVTVPSHTLDSAFFDDGKMFDGSSIAGWKGINESDMVLMPDATTAVLDPFFEETTLILRCDVLEPSTMQGYERDPRSLAKRAEAYLKSTGIGDRALFGPENEFFIFDNVRYGTTMQGSFFEIDSIEAAWSSSKQYEEGNKAHRPGVKGGYFPVPPVDSFQDLRSAMCLALEELGMKAEVHHHEVATAGQCEIGVNANTLVRKADEVQMLKYALHNVAHAYGKTVTFMPKPIVGDNGNGMHVHQSISKDGKPLFAGDKYAGLSDLALYYIGGIIKHAKAINAFTNAATNSYKRLVPGFEAPVMLAYSARNRSASIRIPWVANPKGRRIEVRFPDSTANPYLGFAAMQGSVRPAAGRGEAHSGSLLLAGAGAAVAGCRSRLPQGRRRVHRRRHRRVHRAEDAGSDQGAHVHASAGVRVVLQRVIHGRTGSSGPVRLRALVGLR